MRSGWRFGERLPDDWVGPVRVEDRLPLSRLRSRHHSIGRLAREYLAMVERGDP